MNKPTCPRCGGFVTQELGTNDLKCIHCGWREYSNIPAPPPLESLPEQGQKRR